MDKKTLNDETFRNLIKNFSNVIDPFVSEQDDGRHILIVGVDNEGVSTVFKGKTRDIGVAFMRLYVDDDCFRKLLSVIARTITMWEMLGPDACGALINNQKKSNGGDDAEAIAKAVEQLKAEA